MGVVDFSSEGTIGATFLPKRYDITVYQGDTFKFKTTFRQPPAVPGGTGEPVNIDGWTGKCQVKDAQAAEVLTATITIVDDVGGTVLVEFDDTSAVAGGDYKYDLEMTDGDGDKRTFIGGKFTVVEDITE